MSTPKRRRRALAASAGIATVMVVGLLAWPAWAATHNVQVGDNWFQPDTITIQPGDTVTWSYRGTVQHNVVAADGSWKSQDFSRTGLVTDTYSRSFSEPGTHRYVCTYHGACEKNQEGPCFGDMWGTIIVAGDDPDPEPTNPDPTEPDPEPTEPNPKPRPTNDDPDPEPTDSDPGPSQEPTTPEATPSDRGSPTPTVEPTAAPTPSPEAAPGVVTLGSEGSGENGDRGPMLLFATFLVGVSAAGQVLFARMAAGGLDG